MSKQVSRGSAGEYQSDERAGVDRKSTRLNSRFNDNDQEDLLIVQLEHSYSKDTVNLMTNPVPFFTLATGKLRELHFCNCLHAL